MSATDEREKRSDGFVYQGSREAELAAIAPDAQATRNSIDYERIEQMGYDLLVALGEDPTREGLLGTPHRWASWWREFIEYDAGNTDVTFESASVDQMVVVSGMRTWSLCEHHLLPFWCDITIGYIAGDRVLGLSKFARIAHAKAHKLQIQERLANEIADEVVKLTGSENIAVLCKGQHLCMMMRGIKTIGTMQTSVMRGVFREDAKARTEFLQMVSNG